MPHVTTIRSIKLREFVDPTTGDTIKQSLDESERRTCRSIVIVDRYARITKSCASHLGVVRGREIAEVWRSLAEEAGVSLPSLTDPTDRVYAHQARANTKAL